MTTEILKRSWRFWHKFRGDDQHVGDVLVGYCDSDFAGNIDNRRSRSGYIFPMYRLAISWNSSLQHVVALSTTEVGFMSLTAAVTKSYWNKGNAADFGVVQSAVAEADIKRAMGGPWNPQYFLKILGVF